MISKSKKHLESVNQSYVFHGSFAIKWGFYLVWTGVASIIHGIFPSFFPFTAPRNIARLTQLVKKHHPQFLEQEPESYK